MPIAETDITALAELFATAEERRAPVAPIRLRYPDLTEADAYRVQQALVARKLQGGAQLSGKKIGATNPTAQAAMGLEGPTYGHLFASGEIAAGASVPFASLIHPRLECEVAFLLGQDLAGPGVTAEAVRAATEAVMAAFEIVDARTEGWQVGMREMIADNVFAARYVLSPQRLPVAGMDLAGVAVTLYKNGEQVAAATGANVLGDPAQAMAWLANKLAEHNLHLRAGEIVLAGSLTPLHPVSAGDRFEAAFTELGTVTVAFP